MSGNNPLNIVYTHTNSDTTLSHTLIPVIFKLSRTETIYQQLIICTIHVFLPGTYGSISSLDSFAIFSWELCCPLTAFG